MEDIDPRMVCLVCVGISCVADDTNRWCSTNAQPLCVPFQNSILFYYVISLLVSPHRPCSEHLVSVSSAFFLSLFISYCFQPKPGSPEIHAPPRCFGTSRNDVTGSIIHTLAGFEIIISHAYRHRPVLAATAATATAAIRHHRQVPLINEGTDIDAIRYYTVLYDIIRYSIHIHAQAITSTAQGVWQALVLDATTTTTGQVERRETDRSVNELERN